MTNASTAYSREPIETLTWMRAVGEGDAARVESLLAAGADVNATSESGETALIRAASKGHLHVVRILLAAGADPNAEREDEFTALGMAVFFGYAEIVRALLAGGADPSATGRLGTTAEKWALFNGFTEIAEMLKHPDSAVARVSAAAGAGKRGAAEFFPSEGAISAVVPLSEINELAASQNSPALSELTEAAELETARDTGAGDEPKEQEVATVVRPRPSRATQPRPATLPTAARPEGSRRSWPATPIVLALSLFAGVAAGAGVYLMGSRRSAETQSRAVLAEEVAPATEEATPLVETQSATKTLDPQTSQPAAQLPEPSPTAEQKPLAAPSAPVITAAATEAKAGRIKRDKPAAEPEQPVTATEKRRAPKAEPASRREASVGGRDGRTASHAVGEKTGGGLRPRRTEGRVLTSSSRDISQPVFSPTPSAKSEKKKVIPWP